MHATITKVRNATVTLRPLRSGDTEAVSAALDRLGTRARLLRGTDGAVGNGELALFATADSDHHALIAYDGRDPIGIARLTRRSSDRAFADIVIVVTEEWKGRGLEYALLERVAGDARAVGVSRLCVSMGAERRSDLARLTRATSIERRVFGGGRVEVLRRAA